jgi:hypothetical protein
LVLSLLTVISSFDAALIWLVAALVLLAAVWRARRKRRTGGIGPGAAGTVYDMLNEDKRKAVEIIVEERAGARDPEDKEGIAFQIEHAVVVDVDLAFAWAWRTDVGTWHDPPAEFRLDGAFADGAWGTTRLPGQELRWQVRDVRPERSFVIAMPLDDALLSFEWRFDAVSERSTRITQRIVLSGRNAAAYASEVRDGFAPTIVDGMNRLAAALVTARASRT